MSDSRIPPVAALQQLIASAQAAHSNSNGR